MLNFYNYYGKIHPELMKKLRDIEAKCSDTLIIRVSLNERKYDEELFRYGETIYVDEFGAGDTIKLSPEQCLHIARDIDKILIYYEYDCQPLYKNFSDSARGTAIFGYENNAIKLENCTLTRLLPS